MTPYLEIGGDYREVVPGIFMLELPLPFSLGIVISLAANLLGIGRRNWAGAPASLSGTGSGAAPIAVGSPLPAGDPDVTSLPVPPETYPSSR